MTELTRASDILQELDEGELERVRAIAERREYAAGETVVRQGEVPEAVSILVAGHVRVTAVMAEEDELVGRDEEMLVRVGPNECVGELSFVTGEAPNLSVIAEEPVTLAALPYERLRVLLESDGVLCRKFLFAVTRTLVARLRATGRELVLTRYFIRGR